MIGIGFDSGGTHTTYALDSGSGSVIIDGNECADSISDARGTRSTHQAIAWMTRILQVQEDDEICAWIGAAGFSSASSHALRGSFEAFLPMLESLDKNIEIFIANDAVSLLKAPPLAGVGVSAVVGTGSVVMGCHPRSTSGVIKRGGFEWLVSDEGAGVWMTLEAIRLLIHDIQQQGSEGYHSPLLDRLCDYFGVDQASLAAIPESVRAVARVDAVARVVSEGKPEAKRKIAGFVYPHLFDLAVLQPGKTHDRLAAEVLRRSVEIIARDISEIAEELAACTADNINERSSIPVLVSGNIAQNPVYATGLRQALSSAKWVESVDMIGDAARAYASLAHEYLKAAPKQQREIARSFDPLHSILRVFP